MNQTLEGMHQLLLGMRADLMIAYSVTRDEPHLLEAFPHVDQLAIHLSLITEVLSLESGRYVPEPRRVNLLSSLVAHAGARERMNVQAGVGTIVVEASPEDLDQIFGVMLDLRGRQDGDLARLSVRVHRDSVFVEVACPRPYFSDAILARAKDVWSTRFLAPDPELTALRLACARRLATLMNGALTVTRDDHAFRMVLRLPLAPKVQVVPGARNQG